MNIRTVWGRFRWHWLSLLLSLGGLGCMGGLMWAVQARLSTWDVQVFVGIIYGAMGSAILSSLASRRAYVLAPVQEWEPQGDDSKAEPPLVSPPLVSSTAASPTPVPPSLAPDAHAEGLEPAGEPPSQHPESSREYDLETELEPLWDFSRWLRWMLWAAVMGIALWVWFPPTAVLVGWWERQIAMFFFR